MNEYKVPIENISRRGVGDDDIHQYQRYLDELARVPQGLGREAIYEALRDRIPHLLRHETTPRIMSECGVDTLLDQLNVFIHAEALEMLEEEANEPLL